jgi:hypothetical protein
MKANAKDTSRPAVVKYDATEIALLARTTAERMRRQANDGATTVPVVPSAWAHFLDSVAALAEQRMAESPASALAA